MMHARIWRVMTTTVVEITCNHAEGQERSSHLIYREAFHYQDESGHLVVEALANAAWVAADLAHKGEIDVTAECGWA